MARKPKGRCSHGYVPGDGPAITISGRRTDRADEHDRKCSVSHLFNHEGFWGRVVCCAGCGRKVC